MRFLSLQLMDGMAYASRENQLLRQTCGLAEKQLLLRDAVIRVLEETQASKKLEFLDVHDAMCLFECVASIAVGRSVMAANAVWTWLWRPV